MTQTLLINTGKGLYCPAGDFYIDPWQAVDRALITHAHSDHARAGCRSYLCASECRGVLLERVGKDAFVETLPYRESTRINGVTVSFHPAGHILGSSQIRVEHQGEVWVVSGDYKTEPDKTCAAFEPVPCHTFITESTFGLPIYHWEPSSVIFREINEWWAANQQAGRCSVLFSYSLGKAQRLLGGVDPSLGPLFVHGAVAKFLPAYAAAGIRLPETEPVDAAHVKEARGKALVIAPPSADNSPWLKKFGDVSTAFASGWMQVRGVRRRQALDRGFALSDHVDWDQINQTIRDTGATRIWVTHGYTAQMVRWLKEKGYDASAIKTQFRSEQAQEGGVAPVGGANKTSGTEPVTEPESLETEETAKGQGEEL